MYGLDLLKLYNLLHGRHCMWLEFHPNSHLYDSLHKPQWYVSRSTGKQLYYGQMSNLSKQSRYDTASSQSGIWQLHVMDLLLHCIYPGDSLRMLLVFRHTQQHDS